MTDAARAASSGLPLPDEAPGGRIVPSRSDEEGCWHRGAPDAATGHGAT